VARGEVEISRRAAQRGAQSDNKISLALARLGAGAFFGEMAMMSALPSPSSVVATRPSILLVAQRDTLVSLAGTRPEVAAQLAAHCRRNSLANLGWTSPVVAAVPPIERANMVERLEMRIFEKGDRLVTSGEDAPGLHVVVSGEVAIVAREWDERVLLATLGAGETVGEMELVLCRQSFADAIAIRPTATLFLSREEYSSLVQDYPAILHGLYAIAVQRHAETNFALQSGSAVVADDWLLEPNVNAIDLPPRAAPSPGPRPVAQHRTTLQGMPVPEPEPPPVRHPTPTRRPGALPSRSSASMPPVMPPPPPPSVPLPRTSTAPPTSKSLRPLINSTPPPAPFGWMGPAAAGAAAAALAAGVAMVITMQARQPAASGAAASGGPPQTTTYIAGPEQSVAATSAPGAAAPASTASSTPLVPPASEAAASSASKAAAQARAMPPRPAVLVRIAPPPASGPAAPASTSALPLHTAPPAEAPTAPGSLASGRSTSDEFGGRQ
jgi:CRP-like cAMP-binding protein